VIVEPVAGNMNLVRATPEFLQAMRRLCTRHGAMLVFDEVMTDSAWRWAARSRCSASARHHGLAR